jgi:cell division protein FtsL
MSGRMAPERLAEIRGRVAIESRMWVTHPLRELLAELDAVTAERDALIQAKDEWEQIARNAEGGA